MKGAYFWPLNIYSKGNHFWCKMTKAPEGAFVVAVYSTTGILTTTSPEDSSVS